MHESVTVILGSIMAAIAAGGLVWGASRMASELKGVKEAINGPMTKRIDSVNAKLDDQAERAEAVVKWMAAKDILCATRGMTLKDAHDSAKKALSIIEARDQRHRDDE